MCNGKPSSRSSGSAREKRCLDALIEATRNNDPEVQVRAADGLVNFYLPGYARTGFGGSLRRVGDKITGRCRTRTIEVIDPYIDRPSGRHRGAGRWRAAAILEEVRANTARAAASCAARDAVPDLLEAVRTKDTQVIATNAWWRFQKIRDEAAGARISFLLRDLNPKVQIAAIETTGLLYNREARPTWSRCSSTPRMPKCGAPRSARWPCCPTRPAAICMRAYLQDKDEQRAAAEGYARLQEPATISHAGEGLAGRGQDFAPAFLAFAQVMLGKTELTEFSARCVPDQYAEFERLQRRGLSVPGGTGAGRPSCAVRSTARSEPAPGTRKSVWRVSGQ